MTDATTLNWITQRWHELIMAGGFLTRLPMPATEIDTNVKLGDAIWAFPLFGALVGAVTVGTIVSCQAIGFDPVMSAIAGIAVSCLLTGALHEDGLADCADGIGGGRTRDKKLDIMRDSRIGTYGTLALILSVAARTAALAALIATGMAWTTLVAFALARALLGLIFLSLGPARDDGLSKGAGDAGRIPVAAALTFGVLIGFSVLDAQRLVLASLAGIIAVICVIGIARKYLGGHTGDVFGAAEQLAEISILWALVASATEMA